MSTSIRGLLAFAASSSLILAQGDKPAPQAGAAAGWSASPGKGIKYDGGDAFGLELKNRLQVHFTYANNDDFPDLTTFNIRRARTSLEGHVFARNILYYLQMDWTDNGATGGALKQGWAQWNFSSSEQSTVGLRAGQAKSMYGLESTMTSAGLWFVERSSAARAFADAYTRGAWLNGLMVDNKLRWTAGAMNTDAAAGLSAQYIDRGEETANSDNELSYVFAANFDPMGDFFGGKQTVEKQRQGDWRTDDRSLKGTIGAGLALGNGKDTTAGGPDIESTSININTAWTVEKFNFLGEWFTRTDDPQGGVNDKEEPTGFAVSAGYLLDKSGDSAIQWGIGLRANRIEGDAGSNGVVNYLNGVQGLGGTGIEADVTEVSAVVNAFYHGHPCKTQFEYTFQDVDPSGGLSGVTNHIIRIAFQIEF